VAFRSKVTLPYISEVTCCLNGLLNLPLVHRVRVKSWKVCERVEESVFRKSAPLLLLLLVLFLSSSSSFSPSASYPFSLPSSVLAVLGFELRAFYLVGEHSTTLPAPLPRVNFELLFS
jgi:hypothetical protein